MHSVLYLLGLLQEMFGRYHIIRVWGAEGAGFVFLTHKTDVVLILMISLGSQCVDLEESVNAVSNTRRSVAPGGGRDVAEPASLLLGFGEVLESQQLKEMIRVVQ